MEGDSGLDVLSNDGILDIIPPSEYDPFEAKFCASLFWLVFHATEDGGLEDVPSQVTNPIQRLDKKNGFIVHPEIVEFLCKGEVYCTVCARIFPGKAMLAGHWSVIQTLSRNGVYVVDGHSDVAVTDALLEQTKPFNQGAHIALMDALMTAYSSQVVSIQSVVQAVRRFSTFSASRELPFDLEDALLLWVNKTSIAMNSKFTQQRTGKLLRSREQVKRAGLRSEDTDIVMFPIIDDVLKGLSNGLSLLGVLMFYEPNVVDIEDMCCSSVISTEDSVHNLDMFLGLCSQYFCTSVLALKVEDILYGSRLLKINIVALLAEMFSKCEGNDKSGVQRSMMACSQNGDIRVNGDDTRSHSAPVARKPQSIDKLSNHNTGSDSESMSISKKARPKDKNIALKIQNYVENKSLEVHPSAKPVPYENLTSENMTSSEDVVPPVDTVEVHGALVKLRKKVSRSVEPGGGHEALSSRRMNRSLCGWSQEDVSDAASLTCDHEEQFDAKSDEVVHHTADPMEVPSRTEPCPLNIDLNTLPDDPPVDMLSPISETTEPGGSSGNSLNNSMSSTHGDILKTGGVKDFSLTPPAAQTPRISNTSNVRNDVISRGSYVISDVIHTPESAFAAGIPIVERESGVYSSSSSNAGLVYRSVEGDCADGTHEIDTHNSTNTTDQRYPARNYELEQKSQTFRRTKGSLHQSAQDSKNAYVMQNKFGDSPEQNGFRTFVGPREKTKMESNSGSSITWLGGAICEETSQNCENSRRVKKTNWGEMASEMTESPSHLMQKGNLISFILLLWILIG